MSLTTVIILSREYTRKTRTGVVDRSTKSGTGKARKEQITPSEFKQKHTHNCTMDSSVSQSFIPRQVRIRKTNLNNLSGSTCHLLLIPQLVVVLPFDYPGPQFKVMPFELKIHRTEHVFRMRIPGTYRKDMDTVRQASILVVGLDVYMNVGEEEEDWIVRRNPTQGFTRRSFPFESEHTAATDTSELIYSPFCFPLSSCHHRLLAVGIE